ncbi:MAG: hypothetical protein ACKO1N_06770 [Erythrobacter sp.]
MATAADADKFTQSAQQLDCGAVDPLKDAQADLLMIRTGTMTLAQAIARQGYDPERQLLDIAETNGVIDALGLVLDGDPRVMSKAGTLHPPTEAEDAADQGLSR